MHTVQRKIAVAFLMLFTFLAFYSLGFAEQQISVMVKRGDSMYKIARSHHLTLEALVGLNPQVKNVNLIYPGQLIYVSSSSQTHAPAPKPAPKPPTPPIVPPLVPPTLPTTTPPVAIPTLPSIGEDAFFAYTTGYGYPDNTPAGGDISNGVLHTSAGGVGTFADPITVAVGHSISGSSDTLDYPEGTKFYFPFLKKYGIVEDTCGDGNKPQNGPCHTGYQNHPWLDLWVGGTTKTKQATLDCEDAITDVHFVILNPDATHEVVSGAVYNGSCATLFADI